MCINFLKRRKKNSRAKDKGKENGETKKMGASKKEARGAQGVEMRKEKRGKGKGRNTKQRMKWPRSCSVLKAFSAGEEEQEEKKTSKGEVPGKKTSKGEVPGKKHKLLPSTMWIPHHGRVLQSLHIHSSLLTI